MMEIFCIQSFVRNSQKRDLQNTLSEWLRRNKCTAEFINVHYDLSFKNLADKILLMKTFFDYENYREFLLERYQFLKATKSGFSARFFARKAGVSSPSYFNLVIKGERTLSIEYADKFAKGLSLNADEKKCLKTALRLEKEKSPTEREKLLYDLERLKKKIRETCVISNSHVEILSDLINLKLYLLAQSHQFQFNARWILAHFNRQIGAEELEQRINLLINSGLWKISEGNVQTLAPIIKTGDYLLEKSLMQTHFNLLEFQKKQLKEKNAQERIFGGRTFLVDRSNISRIEKRINQFKEELECEFEDLNATSVYQLHVSFFELD